MSAALDSIQADLRLTNTESSYVLMAFTLAYGLFEIPTGRWGDRIGAAGVDADFPLVVGLHRDDRGVHGPGDAHRGAVPLRGRRGGGLPQRGPRALAVVPG